MEYTKTSTGYEFSNTLYSEAELDAWTAGVNSIRRLHEAGFGAPRSPAAANYKADKHWHYAVTYFADAKQQMIPLDHMLLPEVRRVSKKTRMGVRVVMTCYPPLGITINPQPFLSAASNP